MNMDLNMSGSIDLKNKRDALLNIFYFQKYNLPVKLLGQIHIGILLLLRAQVPPLKQYGIVLLHGLIRV
jgi:hypothetical protein